MIKYLLLIFTMFFPCTNTFAEDYEINVRAFGNWESSLFHVDKTNEDWYTTKYYRPTSQDLFMFSAHSVFPDCDILSFNIYIFNTRIINFKKNNLQGEITIDSHKFKIFYNVFSDGSGMFFVEINSFNNNAQRMVNGKLMTINLPHLMWRRKIDLRNFTKALDRSTVMCIAHTN